MASNALISKGFQEAMEAFLDADQWWSRPPSSRFIFDCLIVIYSSFKIGTPDGITGSPRWPCGGTRQSQGLCVHVGRRSALYQRLDWRPGEMGQRQPPHSLLQPLLFCTHVFSPASLIPKL